MDVYAGIDGTGPFNDSAYAKSFLNSFVNRLTRERPWGKSFYLRGPLLDGQQTRQLSRQMLAELEGALHRTTARKVSRIVVAGYSRGGAAAIRLCRELGKHGHKVDCLLLFDAVDMSLTVEADVVPKNVRHCFHAMRSPLSRSRTSWGNCGTRPEVADARVTEFQPKLFMCTHGGMGGVPWDKADPDGFINEAFTEAGSTRPFIGSLPMLPIVIGNELHRRASRTAITLKQDREESARVGRWMFANLDRVLADERKAVPVG